MQYSIVVDRLTKNFEVSEKKPGIAGTLSSLFNPVKKKVRALKGISFDIQPGELVGFIGPNGAGKTTTMKVLSGLLYPSSGFVSVLDYDPWEKDPRFLKQIALVMGQKNQLWWDLPAIETFELNKEIYEIPERDYQKNLSELVELLGVSTLLKTPVRKLSLGQRMRMELIAALIHQPKILFLDEPTIGLDLIGQQKLRDFIYEYNKKYQATILLTSHNMNDLVDLARRVIVIDKGEIIFDGIFDDLIGKFAKERIIKLTLTSEEDVKKLEEIGKIKKIAYPLVYLSVPRTTASVAASQILQSFPVADLTIEEVPVEDVIRRVFRGSLKHK